MASERAPGDASLKLRVEVDGAEYTLALERNGVVSRYALKGEGELSGEASVVEMSPGVFSVLLGNQSFGVYVMHNGDGLEVWTAGARHSISISDPRDRTGLRKKATTAGPVEVRSQMPGKVIKLLVDVDAPVTAGQGLVVVEAMKMQNEMKSPKDGKVVRICAAEGATIAAGETLVVVE